MHISAHTFRLIDTTQKNVFTNHCEWTSFIVGLFRLINASVPTCLVNTSATRHTLVVVAHATLSALARAWRLEAKCNGTEWGAVWTLIVRIARSSGEDLRFLGGPMRKSYCFEPACFADSCPRFCQAMDYDITSISTTDPATTDTYINDRISTLALTLKQTPWCCHSHYCRNRTLGSKNYLRSRYRPNRTGYHPGGAPYGGCSLDRVCTNCRCNRCSRSSC